MILFGRKSLLFITLLTTILLLLASLMGTSVRAQDNSTATPSVPVNPDLLTDIEVAELQVREIRQLTLTGALNRQFLEPEQIQQRVVEDVLGTYTPQDAEQDALFYAAFGFVEPDTDLIATVNNLIKAQSSGFYDVQANTIYLLPTNRLGAFNSMLYARHYFYALQAQNFHTTDLLTPDLIINTPDQAMAIRALLEGDAQLVTLRYIQDFITTNATLVPDLITQAAVSSIPPLDGAPAIFKQELLFPSETGAQFVETLYNATGDWRLVNMAYQRPPLSTEHILHPELYLLYEEPQAVELRSMDEFFATLPEDERDWTLVRDQTLGEFYLLQHLMLHLEPEAAQRVAAGWGGDRFMLYTRDDQMLMVWRSRWDSDADALDFDTRYGAFLGEWFNIGGSVVFENLACWYNNFQNACKTTIDGEVLVAFAPSSDLALKLLEFQANVTRSSQIFG